MGEVEDALKATDGYHDPSTVPDFSSLPDDTYQARLDKIYVQMSKRNTLQTVMEWEIINGDYAFRRIMKWCGMDKEMSLDFLTQDLRKLGLTEFHWSSVQDHFGGLIDKIAEITLKSKVSPKDGKTYQSCYIQKVIDMNAAMTTERKISGDDIPF